MTLLACAQACAQVDAWERLDACSLPYHVAAADQLWVAQTISTLLSEHVLANYDSFAAGIEDVQVVDEQLQVRLPCSCSAFGSCSI